MMSTEIQSRLTRSCSDAAVGYATATTAAYAAMTTRTMDYWAEQIRSMLPEEEEQPRSWYRHPDGPQRKRRPQPAPVSLMPGSWPQVGFLDPASVFTSWLGLLGSPRAPTAWPMAMMFMAAGVPRNVAMPVAEANAAAIEATKIASAVVKDAFSSYRTDSGHASTHVVAENRRTLGAGYSAMPKAPLPAIWPWMPAFSA